MHPAFTLDAELWDVDAVTGGTKVSAVTRTSGSRPVELEWSRDGSFIAVAEPGQIRVVRMDGGTSDLIPVEGATPSSLGWTAGDERIIYIGNDASGDGQAVHTVNLDGHGDTKLTPHATDLQLVFDDATASPDGTRVAYVQRTHRCANESCSQDPERLLTSDTDGSHVIEVPIPPGYGASGLQWSPDGARLLLSSIDGLVSVGVAPGSPPVVESKGELNLEWSASEATWQP